MASSATENEAIENEKMMTDVTDLQAVYDAEKEQVVLSYGTTNAEYVKIYVNGAVEHEEYTGTVYYYEEAKEGNSYTFIVEPYDANGKKGISAEITLEIKYNKAVLKELDVDYDLEEKVLIIDWDGQYIANVDILQDSVPIAEKMTGDRYLSTAELTPLTKYVYTVIPYNTVGEQGEAKTIELQVGNYEAQIADLDVVYDEINCQMRINWAGIYTSYIQIYLNDELLADKYTEKSFTYPCKLQPGATYILSLVPFDEKKEEGEVHEEDITFGEFEIPDVHNAKLTHTEVLNSANQQTGFCRPAVNLTWDAQKRAVYEIYRAKKDKKASYAWVATVTPDITGKYTYTDDTVGIGKYYYKVRRKIKEDSFNYQDLYSALSDSVGVNVSLPKPKVTALLGEDSTVNLAIGTTKEYVSGYEIYRKESGKSFRKIAVISGNTYTDTAIDFDKSYTYKVRSYFYNLKTGKKLYGKYSSNIKVKTTVGVIEAKASQISENEIKLEWNAVPNAQGYEIYYKTNAMGDSYALLTKTSEQSYSKKVGKSTAYFFLIKAYRENAHGNTYFSSAEVSGKMGLSAPKGLTAKKFSYKWNKKTQTLTEKVTLSWDRVYGAEGYYIEYYDTVNKTYTELAEIIKGTKTTYVVSNTVTKAQTPIRYRIKAYKGNKVKAGETIDIVPNLGKVKKVSVKEDKSKVTIKWKKQTGAEGYLVYRSNGRHSVLVGDTTGLTMTDSGCMPGIEYEYYVEAYNKTLGLIGNRSDTAAYRTEAGKVSGFTVESMEDGAVKLSWKAKKDVKAYRIYFSTEKNGEYQLLKETTALTYAHKNVEALVAGRPEAAVYYRITAVQVNSAGIEVESLPKQKKVEKTELIKGKL